MHPSRREPFGGKRPEVLDVCRCSRPDRLARRRQPRHIRLAATAPRAAVKAVRQSGPFTLATPAPRSATPLIFGLVALDLRPNPRTVAMTSQTSIPRPTKCCRPHPLPRPRSLGRPRASGTPGPRRTSVHLSFSPTQKCTKFRPSQNVRASARNRPPHPSVGPQLAYSTRRYRTNKRHY